MLSYQHHYHAGNFADIHKHLHLLATLKRMQKKTKPLTLLDAHAGNGVYDLAHLDAQKTNEAQQGILALQSALASANRDQNQHLPSVLQAYHDCIEQVQATPQTDHSLAEKHTNTQLHSQVQTWRYYPGSPSIAAHALREQDSWIGLDLHPTAYQELSRCCHGQSNFSCHQRDAYEGMHALIATADSRAAVLIDPSYEIKDDYREMPDQIARLLKKMRQLVVLLWYPILAENRHQSMIEAIEKRTEQDIWQSEWRTTSAKTGMLGSGILVINPPWQLDQDILSASQWLHERQPFMVFQHSSKLTAQ